MSLKNKKKTALGEMRAKDLAVSIAPPADLPPLQPVGDDVLRNPVELFRHLTQWTCPHGFEKRYYGRFLESLGFVPDTIGNWYREVPAGEGRASTAFMAHLDTADRMPAMVHHVLKNGCLSTNGTSLLGADDRAGMTVLLYLLAHDVPGLYCFFVGEECGCVGSRGASRDTDRFLGIDRAICFDRRGMNSIITLQCGQRTCSDEFAEHLACLFDSLGLPMKPDPTGVYTDSREFATIIPECTNISVGYEHAHSVNETQDLGFLVLLCAAAAEIDWESLPVARDISDAALEAELDEWTGWGTYGTGDGSLREIYGTWNRSGKGDAESYTESCTESGTDPFDDTPCRISSGRKEIDRILNDLMCGYRVGMEDVLALVDRPIDEAADLVLRLLERIQDEAF